MIAVNRPFLSDKGLIQAEYIVNGNNVIKERLVFMKKHNKIWSAEEIAEYEILEEDWFAEYQIQYYQ